MEFMGVDLNIKTEGFILPPIITTRGVAQLRLHPCACYVGISSQGSGKLNQGTQTADIHKACWSSASLSIYYQSPTSASSGSSANLACCRVSRSWQKEGQHIGLAVESPLRTAEGRHGNETADDSGWTCSSLDRFLLPGTVGSSHSQAPPVPVGW